MGENWCPRKFVKLRAGAVPNTDPTTGQFRKPRKKSESICHHDNRLRKVGPKRARRRDLAYIDELVAENEQLLSREFSIL